MIKIILVFLLAFTFIPEKAFSFAYNKKINQAVASDGSVGKQEEEGFFVTEYEAPNCKRLNKNFNGMIQGQKINYNSNGKAVALENGLFGCKLTIDNKKISAIWEGVVDFLETGEKLIFFKSDEVNSHMYSKKKNQDWYYATRNKDAAFFNQPSANVSFRPATKSEIEQAENLYQFYKNIDLSSPSAKIYGDVINKNTQLNKITASEKEVPQSVNQQKKIAVVEDNKQKAIKEKKAVYEAKAKEEQIKISKMKPEDRHAYTCKEKFGFRKGSDKFKDCVFEMYKAETELEKLELQKKIIEANLEATRARESAARTEQDRNNALLERQTLAQERTAAAAAQQARIANFESSQRMIDDGLALMRGDRNLAGQVRQPQQRLQTNCTFTGRFMSCF